MTTTCTFDGSLDPHQVELEKRYQNEFPGFEPATWAAMAYYSKGYSYEDVRMLLAKRFGDELVAKRDALAREAKMAGKTDYDPNPEPVFKLEDVPE
jgi:hypothetical protein